MGSIEEIGSIELELDDLSQLPTLTEKSILAATTARFKQNKIYTYIGEILIAVNPYKKLDIYDHEAWQKKQSESVGRRPSPHVYSIASLCYNELLQSGESQCCVIIGESGAGKTETTKFLLEHIVHVTRQKAKTDIHVKIIQVNPLLEAFGNAKTVMNDNSSRFGKFIELYFDSHALLYGAHISEYLLEKSRVVHCNRDEGNFHVFNYLLSSITDDQQRSLFLTQRTYRISPKHPTPAEDAVFYTQWQHLLHIMDAIGFMTDEVHMVTVVLAAIIHLAEIVFEEDSETNGVFITNEHSLEHVSTLLELNTEDFARALISSKFTIKDESVVILKNVSQANEGRDALVKALYSRLFGWIVRQVNAILQPNKPRSATSTIGILDIAGFENASVNGFEQLCINATNEQLNFYFNQRIFQWELDEYRHEGLDVSNLTFVDNRCVVNLLLESPLGVFSLLDEESKFPKASDKSFVDKLHRMLGKVPCFHRPKGTALCFIIHHSPTSITYTAENFLEKNRDTLSLSLQQCLAASERHLVAELFTAQTSETGALLATAVPLRSRQSLLRCKQRRKSILGGVSLSKQAGRKLKQRAKNVNSTQLIEVNSGQTLSNQFKNSLADLMGKLLDCKQWFIRCLKPNANKTPGIIDNVLLGNQLRYTGVLDTVEIQRQGFATRLSFASFLYRYQCVVYPMSAEIPATPAGCANVLNKLGLFGWQIGKNKVFLKHWHTEELDSRLAVIIAQVIVCQAVARRWLARRLYHRMKLSIEQYSDQCRVFLTSVQQHSENIVDQLKIQLALDTTLGRTLPSADQSSAGKLERSQTNACDSRGKKLPSTIYTPTPFTLGAGLPPLPDDVPPSPSALRTREPSPVEIADVKSTTGDSGGHLTVGAVERSCNGATHNKDGNCRKVNDCLPVSLAPPPFALTPKLSPVKLRSVNNGPTRGKPNPSSAGKDTGSSVSALTCLDPGQNQAAAAKTLDFYKMLFDKAMAMVASRANDNPWAVLHYIEKDRVQASFCLLHSDIVVNNSNLSKNNQIGLNGVKVERRHFKVARILKAVGEGVRLTRDGEGNVYASRLSECDLIVKGYKDPTNHCLSSAVIENMGRLGTVPMKIFDMTEFNRHISQLTTESHPPGPGPSGDGSSCRASASLHRLCQVSVSFQQNTFNDLLTPCWLCLIYTAACPPNLLTT